MTVPSFDLGRIVDVPREGDSRHLEGGNGADSQPFPKFMGPPDPRACVKRPVGTFEVAFGSPARDSVRIASGYSSRLSESTSISRWG